MPSKENLISDCWVIGYGNSHRGDDGIGPYVANRVEQALKHRKGVQTRALYQLDPALIEELQDAATLIFVDASMEIIDNGWKWTRIEPDFRGFYHVTHLFGPCFLLGLIHSLYQRYPDTWLVTVQGDKFDFKESLTPGAGNRACQAVSEILNFLDIHQTQTICNPMIEAR